MLTLARNLRSIYVVERSHAATCMYLCVLRVTSPAHGEGVCVCVCVCVCVAVTAIALAAAHKT